MFKFISLFADLIIIGVFVWLFGTVVVERIQKWWQFSNIRIKYQKNRRDS